MPVVSDGFDFPLGSVDAGGRRAATAANDGDGFYVASDLSWLSSTHWRQQHGYEVLASPRRPSHGQGEKER
jgi:hypothetical protein